MNPNPRTPESRDTCRQTQAALADALWTAETLREAAALAAHVEQCPACRTALNEYEQAQAALRAEPTDHPEPSGGWSAFEDRLVERIDRPILEPTLQMSHGSLSDTLHAARFRAARPRLAVAALALIAVAGWAAALFVRPGNERPAPPSGVPMAASSSDTADAAARMNDPDAARQVSLFREVSEAFDRRAGWVATADGAAGVGLLAASDPADQPQRLLLLRLTVQRGDETVSRADLAIVAGRDAELTLPFEQGEQLRYHVTTTAASPLELTLWAEIISPSRTGRMLAAVATTLAPHDNQVLPAGELVTNSGRYRLKIAFRHAEPDAH